MGTKNLYTIFDKVACECGPVMIFNNDEQAARAYPLAFKGKEASSKDFMMCRIGSINPETMVITSDLVEDITPFVEDGQ